ncbi:methylaspartate ammonia-lyase, partial [Morganella morganii]|nr:methylaspartate ammonia-lyase [Morganella morganii]
AAPVLYCKKHGIEAYQVGTCNETDVSARTCVHIAIATRPMNMLIKPDMGFNEGMNIVHNEMNRTLAVLKAKA